MDFVNIYPCCTFGDSGTIGALENGLVFEFNHKSFLVKFASGGCQRVGQEERGVVVAHFEADGGEAVGVWSLEQQGAGLAVLRPVVEELGKVAVLYLHDVSLRWHRWPPFLRVWLLWLSTWLRAAA